FFYQSVKLLCASRSRLLKLEAENRRLYAKLEETRAVDRAKCALVRHRGMTEPQAHRYIEKQSMDARQSKTVTAENILRVYEA
ncbi:ANTAR domain-containing response regulator, partial [Treponema endosymbiont of Eucomonympha sp.]